jgi:tetratricopeptide (TPR) repeat protein
MRFLPLALLLTIAPLTVQAQAASPEERMQIAEQRILGILGIEAEATEHSKDPTPAKAHVEQAQDEYDPFVTLGNFLADLQEASLGVLGAGMGNLGAVAAQQNGGSVNQHSADAQLLAGKAFAVGANGNRAKAIELYEQAVKLDPRFSKAFYNLACECAKDQQRQKALLNLQKALQLSSSLKADAQQDPDFATLRDEHEFKNMIK